ncbi:MAG: hypothetical protein ACI8SR_000302 [Oceanicoccus sp.]|jgi:hypothetical protein
MKKLYEAQNSIEAHMIVNLLEQAGMSGHVDGEHLQGGVGEIQVSGLVRVMVEDADYVEALSIIKIWEAQQPEAIEEVKVITKRKNSLFIGVIGFCLGLACMYIYFYEPVEIDGVDQNGDGKIDEEWVYKNGYIRESKIDRNFDGEMDLITTYNRFGKIRTSISDDDFNSTFETTTYYKRGNAELMESDTSGDGFKDFRVIYENDIGVEIHFLNPKTKNIKRVQKLNPFKIYESQLDSNDDGVLDTIYRYDEYEQVIETIIK